VVIESMMVGPIMANCYIVGCDATREAVVIDPGGDGDRIVDAVNRLQLKLSYILNTHGHFDHVGANKEVSEATGAPILIHEKDAPMLGQLTSTARMFGLHADNSPAADKMIADGDRVTFGDLSLEVIHTPGHTPGGVSFFGEGHLFVGDTLFAGSIGRTDLPGGNYDTLISSIQQKLFPLGDDVQVHPGHMGNTTIGQEKQFNPFCGLR